MPIVRTDLTSFRLAHRPVRRSSRLEITAVATLTLSATGLWLFVLPLELLTLVAG